jgi:hypothetical protein
MRYVLHISDSVSHRQGDSCKKEFLRFSIYVIYIFTIKTPFYMNRPENGSLDSKYVEQYIL